MAACLAACGGAPEIRYDGPTAEWIDFGGAKEGLQYAPLTQIDRENVHFLELAWQYHTGDVSDGDGAVPSTTAFEATPIVVDGAMFLCSPFNRVIALAPESGAELWTFDPEIDLSGRYANQLVCRGVTHWKDSEDPEACADRIFTATNDARLIALDASGGRPCTDFGAGGEVDLTAGVGTINWTGEYQVTSAPSVIHDLVVVGSAISDNARTDAPSGAVRAFDARTGELRWAWDPAPREDSSELTLGTPNVWGPMAVDEERDLLFAPTGNPAPDYYGGQRGEIDRYGSSVVALRGSTGELVWSFQTVHHDVWDYDLAAQPTLAELTIDGAPVPALIQATKMGYVFVLHRETGEPLFPVEERAVPGGGVDGETLSPTQPFPVKPPPLTRLELTAADAWGFTPWDRDACREKLAALRYDGPFTPPSLEGTLMLPGNAGGTNWGGVAVDPERGLLLVNVFDLPFAVGLFPAEEYERRKAEMGVEVSPQRGTPYGMWREQILSPIGAPCTPPPWGTLAAIDLTSGDVTWQKPFGTLRDITPIPWSHEIGMGNVAGPLATAGGADLYRFARQLPARVRQRDGRVVVEGQATGGGASQSDELSAPRRLQAVHRHRRRRAWPRRHKPGRRRRGLRPAE